MMRAQTMFMSITLFRKTERDIEYSHYIHQHRHQKISHKHIQKHKRIENYYALFEYPTGHQGQLACSQQSQFT